MHMAFVPALPVTVTSSRLSVCLRSSSGCVAPRSHATAASRAVLMTVNEGERPKSADDTESTAEQHVPWPAMNVEQQLVSLTASLLGFSVALAPGEAMAAVPEGLKEAFKSIPASLVHPAVMWAAVGTTLYTFWLGYQSSRVRQVDAATRKELIKERFADRHFQLSSALFAGVSIATFSGMANTFTRTGKLFPGPHLYAGLGIVALMSVMSAFVPYMQKGKDWARNSHFAAAFIVTGLFLWQAKSGMDIVGKLLKW